jgi:hypothetical protein
MLDFADFLQPHLLPVFSVLIASMVAYCLCNGHKGWRGALADVARFTHVSTFAYFFFISADWWSARALAGLPLAQLLQGFGGAALPRDFQQLLVPLHWGWRVELLLLMESVTMARSYWETAYNTGFGIEDIKSYAQLGPLKPVRREMANDMSA